MSDSTSIDHTDGSQHQPTRNEGTSELLMATQVIPRWQTAADYDQAWLANHIHSERREASLLSEIREAVFGAQDGLTSVLAVASTVGAASGDTYAVMVAGLAATLAGVFSMAAGEYMSSKSQGEIFDAQIAMEAAEVEERPVEAEAEIAYLFEEEGLSRAASLQIAAEIAKVKHVLLKTMVEKELGLVHEGDNQALRGALIMGLAFGLAGLIPVLPYLFFSVGEAVYASTALAGASLFAMGVAKSRWTRRRWWASGLEIFVLGTLASVAGYVFGTLLPHLLGVAGVTA
jgi:vacuolar iron transporter family protein